MQGFRVGDIVKCARWSPFSGVHIVLTNVEGDLVSGFDAYGDVWQFSISDIDFVKRTVDPGMLYGFMNEVKEAEAKRENQG